MKIDTLDNPGWRLQIDLRETNLQATPFSRVEHGEPANDLEDWSTFGSWWIAEVKDETFDVACGPLDPSSAIQIFRDWVESPTQ